MQKQAYDPPGDSDDMDGHSPPGEVERLAAELNKWQERVPKLSAALRERSERVKTLERQLQEFQGSHPLDPGNQSDAGIKARDELITELEDKNRELNTLHKAAQGQLHSGGMEIDELHAEVQSWKEKWQSLTQSLDDQASMVAERDNDLKDKSAELTLLKSKLVQHDEELDEKAHQIEALSEETESLTRRNENLFETTELANRQIETLGDNLGTLRRELLEKDQVAIAATTEFDELKIGLEAETQKSLGKDEDVDVLLASVASKQEEIDVLQSKLVDHEAALLEQHRLGVA